MSADDPKEVPPDGRQCVVFKDAAGGDHDDHATIEDVPWSQRFNRANWMLGLDHLLRVGEPKTHPKFPCAFAIRVDITAVENGTEPPTHARITTYYGPYLVVIERPNFDGDEHR